MKIEKALKNDPEGYALEILMNVINSDKPFTVHNEVYKWEDLTFFPVTGTVIYKGKEYVSRTMFTDILLENLLKK